MNFDICLRSVKDLRQVTSTPKRVCAAAWNSPFENGVDRKGAPSPTEFAKRSLAENTQAMRRWSAGTLPVFGKYFFGPCQL